MDFSKKMRCENGCCTLSVAPAVAEKLLLLCDDYTARTDVTVTTVTFTKHLKA